MKKTIKKLIVIALAVMTCISSVVTTYADATPRTHRVPATTCSDIEQMSWGQIKVYQFEEGLGLTRNLVKQLKRIESEPPKEDGYSCWYAGFETADFERDSAICRAVLDRFRFDTHKSVHLDEIALASNSSNAVQYLLREQKYLRLVEVGDAVYTRHTRYYESSYAWGTGNSGSIGARGKVVKILAIAHLNYDGTLQSVNWEGCFPPLDNMVILIGGDDGEPLGWVTPYRLFA